MFLNRQDCAKALGIGLLMLDKMRKQPGFPEYRGTGSPLFDLDLVQEWIRDQMRNKAQQSREATRPTREIGRTSGKLYEMCGKKRTA